VAFDLAGLDCSPTEGLAMAFAALLLVGSIEVGATADGAGGDALGGVAI
jgi:hypothetical protein